jgi:two-component system, LytTR family, sensor kinase
MPAKNPLFVNDRLARLLGIPLLSVVIPLLQCEYVSQLWSLEGGVSILSSLLHTLAFWEGNRAIVVWFRQRFPAYQQVARRLVYQFLAVTVYSALMATFLWLLNREVIAYFGIVEQTPYTLRHAYSLGLGITYTVLVFYECVFFFERWKQSVIEAERLKVEQVKTQLESLKNQVNPHFLFNTLNTLSSLIPQDPELSVKFVQKLSEVYRYVLDTQAHELVSMQEEWQFTEAFLFLLNIRHGERLVVKADLPAAAMEARIVPLALQILIENAVKHNVVSARYPLTIELFLEENFLVVRNGLKRKNRPQERTGLGLTNLRERCQLLIGRLPEVRESDLHFTVKVPLQGLPTKGVAAAAMAKKL